MLLSTAHKFLFVHVPKTAGAATQRMLEPYCNMPERTLWRSFKRRLPIRVSPEDSHFRVHETAMKLRAQFGRELYDSVHSFAVCRNPYDHAVSHFEYMKQYRSKRIATQFESVAFKDYLQMRARPKLPWERVFVNLPDQSHYVVDRGNKIIVDRMMSFETIHKDLHKLQVYLGMEPEPLPEFNTTKTRNKRTEKIADYFGPPEIELVQRIYDRDFNVFGYSRDIEHFVKSKPAFSADRNI